MNKRILNRYNFWLFCLLLSLASCSAEQLPNDSTTATGQSVEVRLQVRARSGSSVTDNENAINRLRLVVFGSAGSRDAGKLILNKYYATPPAGNSLTEIITSGKRDIYLMANEPLNPDGTEQDSYKNIAAVADIRKLSLGYQGAGAATNYIPSEIPMFLEHLNKQIVVDSSNELSGELERMMAKVTLILKVSATDFKPSDQRVIIDHVTIKNLPTESYLKAKKYQGTLVSSEKQIATEVIVGDTSEYTHTFYVPEYLLTDPNLGASIEIVGHRNGSPSMTSKWSVKLGDAMDDANGYGDRYDITRNRHYTFTGQVKSYGEADLEFRVGVRWWDLDRLSEGLGRFISFVALTDGAGKEVADSSNLADEGMTLNVSCSTDAGGWYTVTRNAKGAIIHRSSATSLVSSKTTQTVSVPIPKLDNLPYLQGYTVSIYHLILAPESIGPVKTFSFTQYGFFIPRSVLVAAGWPDDKLPAHGLQVAKRGNKVLPTGVAEKEDPWLEWKTSETDTPGTEPGLGMGINNTAKMAGGEHPVAQYCRDMGEGWFLPSNDELLLIWNNKSTLPSSYSFLEQYYYWTSTQRDYNTSHDFIWATGMVNYAVKTNTIPVRCVREF